MLDQRQRRLADAVQMLYKCFVFAGYLPFTKWHVGYEPLLARWQIFICNLYYSKYFLNFFFFFSAWFTLIFTHFKVPVPKDISISFLHYDMRLFPCIIF